MTTNIRSELAFASLSDKIERSLPEETRRELERQWVRDLPMGDWQMALAMVYHPSLAAVAISAGTPPSMLFTDPIVASLVKGLAGATLGGDVVFDMLDNDIAVRRASMLASYLIAWGDKYGPPSRDEAEGWVRTTIRMQARQWLPASLRHAADRIENGCLPEDMIEYLRSIFRTAGVRVRGGQQ